jgi:phosphomannomutase
MERTDNLILRSSSSADTTPEMGILLGHALAQEFKRVVIGMDLMKSSPMMKDAVISGLLSSGTDVIDIGVVSGPVAAYAARMGDCCVYVTEFRQPELVSGYLLINKDGSYFGQDQVRHIVEVAKLKHVISDYNTLGVLKIYHDAIFDYNKKLIEKADGIQGGSVVLNCNCGLGTDSAPQIMNQIGTDVIAINAQKDRNFVSNSLSTKEADIRHMKALVESNAGLMGISLNRIGTLQRVFDESGVPLTDEQVLALIILYLRPEKIVVPMDMTWFIKEIFSGNAAVEINTPHPNPDPEKMEFIVAKPNAGSVVKAMRESGADIGYYDGGIIYSDISYSPDAMMTSIAIAQISATNNIGSLVEQFQEFYSERKAYKLSCSHEDFTRMVDSNMEDVNPTKVTEDECWRVDMAGGGFYMAFDPDIEDSVNVIAESNDKLYLISLIEVIDGLMEKCVNGQ